MNSDLIITTFDDADEALKVFDAMRAMRKEPLLNLEQCVIVTRDRAGKIKLYQTRDLTPNDDAATSDALGLLAGLMFGSPIGIVWGVDVGRAMHALTQRGFDEKFVQIVEKSVGHNGSAILFLVRQDSRSDRDEVLNVLGLFKGKVQHTTLSPEVEMYLAQTLAERNRRP